MKTAKFYFALLLLSGNVVATYTPAGANEIAGLVSKHGFNSESYCLMQNRASVPESVPGVPPLLKLPNSGELIDYYGPCDETPVEQGHPDTQRLDRYGWGK